eukprot:753846-Hanusia_phi.AAC.1
MFAVLQEAAGGGGGAGGAGGAGGSAGGSDKLIGGIPMDMPPPKSWVSCDANSLAIPVDVPRKQPPHRCVCAFLRDALGRLSSVYLVFTICHQSLAFTTSAAHLVLVSTHVVAAVQIAPIGASRRTWVNILQNKESIDYCTSEFHYLMNRSSRKSHRLHPDDRASGSTASTSSREDHSSADCSP